MITIHPNSDLGFSFFSNKIIQKSKIKLFKNIDPNIFLALLSLSKCLIGNSSSGIREACYFGTPVINIGDRQKGRLAGKNVLNCKPTTSDIIKCIKIVFTNYSRFPVENLYGEDKGAKKIVKIIKNTNWRKLELSKTFVDKI